MLINFLLLNNFLLLYKYTQNIREIENFKLCLEINYIIYLNKVLISILGDYIMYETKIEFKCLYCGMLYDPNEELECPECDEKTKIKK